MYDIIIVGSGPAGANLARLVGNKYKVLLLDKRDMQNENPDNHSSKCCGGLLAPDAQKMIAKLSLGIPKDILVDPQLFAVRTIDLTNHLERLYQRFYFNMDRERFDRWLVDLIPDSVDKKFNAIFKCYSKSQEDYEITYIHQGKELTAKTKLLVGADGAHSKLRMTLDNSIKLPKRYIAIQEWFECSDHIPYFTAIFDEEISDFYSWIIPKENHLLLGAALRPNDAPKEKFEILKSKLSHWGFHLDNKIKTEGAYINRTIRTSQLYTGNDSIALIGEAAGAISPSSAEGISYALKSSLYLAQSLDKGIDGFASRYEYKMKNIRVNLLLKNLKSPAMYNPQIRNLAMKSGLQSIK
jgi:flavin-dependent dehydrogenase